MALLKFKAKCLVFLYCVGRKPSALPSADGNCQDSELHLASMVKINHRSSLSPIHQDVGLQQHTKLNVVGQIIQFVHKHILKYTLVRDNYL